MAALPSFIFHNPFSLHFHPQIFDLQIFSFAFLIFCIALSLIFFSFSVFKKLSTKTEQQQTQNPQNYHHPGIVKHSPSHNVDEVHHQPNGDSPTRSFLLEVLPSDSAKWARLFDDKSCDGDDPVRPEGRGGGREDSGEEQREKKKKRKAKKKKMHSQAEDCDEHNKGLDSGLRREPVCLYPFTSSSSALQRKIKQQYDELVKSHESKKLTLAQVVNFTNSLIDARNELQHKADVIQRKFVITKALLFKADRSSFDRLRQQIYKLELEQKRLEEDAVVYNWLQQQLKLSPAYKKMLEIGACMETCKPGENTEDEFDDISFEELLAQEKKDSFWQKNGKTRTFSS
ncbi:AT1G17665-like protein [Senna tora]|uniref:AT1G17665-like protein n=1 Tax=Senna tora TaxID=362788 RepID=A0A834WCJ0_9FABA|nr:AT1G17665-like protein [Senna tora]